MSEKDNVETPNKLTILYITFIDFNGQYKSGSQVRPIRMLEAFNSLGYNVKVLEGAADKKNVGRRKKNVKAMLNWVENNHVDICYVEPPSGPFFCTLDLKLLQVLKGKGVPIGLFYRDAYWKFPNFEPPKGLVGRIKSQIICKMQKRDWKIFEKTCKCIYFPSEMLASYFVNEPKWILPPGCQIEEQVKESVDKPYMCGIYVGGASEQYGICLLLDSFQKINSENTRVQLKCICPENQWRTLSQKYQEYENSPWCEILHISSGEALDKVYETVDFAIIPRLKSEYTDLSMPVKMFEYLSNCKPIISTDCVESARFIEHNKIGIIVEDNVESLVTGIEKMIGDKELCEQLQENCVSARAENTWQKRAKKVVNDLLEKR